jgi:hypothetical protein
MSHDSIETLARKHLPPIFGALSGAADPNRYLTLDQFDRVAVKYGLMDASTTNGERALQRGRAKNAINAAMSDANMSERLLSLSGTDRLAAKRPDGWSIVIAQPHQSFALEAMKRRQKLKNGFGRLHNTLSELQAVAVALDAEGSASGMTVEMGKVLGVVEATRVFVDFQLDRIAAETKLQALHDGTETDE